jgi:hypothetical protein
MRINHDGAAGVITTGYATDYALNGRPTHRMLYRAHSGAWKRIGTRRAMDIFAGRLAWPEFAGHTVVVASAYLETILGKPVRLERVERSLWTIKADGYIDEEIVRQQIQQHLNTPRGKSVDKGFDAGDIRAIELALGIP